MKTLDQQLARLLELKDEAAITVGMISEVKSKLHLYIENPELAEDHFSEEKIRYDLNRYSQQLAEVKRELKEINGEIQELAGINSS